MSWKLWLDDQKDDPVTPARWAPEGFIGAASTDEAMGLVADLGPPDFMDLDHDLGENDSAMKFLRWLANSHFETCPDFNVHSANPIGRANIVSFMNSWQRSL